MIDLYAANKPNGQKASIMLEEIGLPYQLFPINIGQGEQNTASFRAINRYLDESIRLLDVLNQHLTDREFITNDYSIADIMNYGWTSSGLNFLRAF
jgi:glutathione S-transferase